MFTAHARPDVQGVRGWGCAPRDGVDRATTLDSADGFVVVTAEYNHSVPAALKNLLDHFQSEYLYKPSAIVTYSAGPFGGVRSLVNMRGILGGTRHAGDPELDAGVNTSAMLSTTKATRSTKRTTTGSPVFSMSTSGTRRLSGPRAQPGRLPGRCADAAADLSRRRLIAAQFGRRGVSRRAARRFQRRADRRRAAL